MDFSPSSVALSPSTQSPIFRPRRSDDWDKYRDIIEDLYFRRGEKLKNVVKLMEEQHNFHASEKQYKDRLAAWGCRKNFKAKEVHLMYRKKKKRLARGKQTAFRHLGRDVDRKHLKRFEKRYLEQWEAEEEKKKDTKEQSPEPKTPSDMTCYTPEHVEDTPTPVSPVRSPSGDPAAYPLNYDPTQIDTFPDLIMDDSAYLHSNRRVYHPSEVTSRAPVPTTMPTSTMSMAPAPIPGSSHHAHPHPHVHHTHPQTHPFSPHGWGDFDTHHTHHTHGPEWNGLDAFQTRLLRLETTLNETMSKYAREQDPDQEIPHHEGLGM